MRVIARSTLREFWESHPDAEQPLKSWFQEVVSASWQNPQEIRQRYRSASILKLGSVVFNIAGNKYRLVTHISFTLQIVFVKFIGTHAEYDQIDAQTVERTRKR
jgi:mRNA interferase HigB